MPIQSLLIALLLTPFNNWTLFKDINGGFMVKIPCKNMKHSVQNIKTGMGELAYHSYVCVPEEADAENKVYIVNYIDYPQGLLHRDSVDLRKALLEETVQSSVSNVGGILAYSDNISLKGVEGRFWRINYNKSNAIMKNRAFIVNSRLFLIQVATTKARSRNREADVFLDSFSWF